MSQFRKSTPPARNSSISQARQLAAERATELINFSFKYLDGSHNKFNFHFYASDYFCEVLNRAKDISGWTKQEVLSNRSASLRAHPIEWSDTSEVSGFNFPRHEEIIDTPYQFAVSVNAHGRIHGLFIYNTFYIVWLDKDHRLYS